MAKRNERTRAKRTGLKPPDGKATGSADSSAKGIRGRPFEKGNSYRWKPGQSGNPTGSSRKQILSDAYRDMLAQPMPVNLKEHIAEMIADGATVAEIIAWATASGALKGNIGAVAEIRRATEGSKVVTENAELTDEERVDRIMALLDAARARRAA